MRVNHYMGEIIVKNKFNEVTCTEGTSKKMKILVTGGAGYIGSVTCSALIDSGHTPVILDSLVTGRREFTKGRIWYQGDIANHDLLAKIVEEHPDIECCIHFAARIIIPESVENPCLYYEENVVKSISLFNSLKILGIKNVIFSSSASLYKPTEDFVVTEESELRPLSPYARTKLCMELVLEDFCNAGYLHGISLRYFNPIGADVKMRSGPFVSDPSHILGRLANVAMGVDPEFYIAGTDWPTRDGSAIRDYIHISDLAKAHVLAVEKASDIFSNTNYCIINLGSGEGVTVREFVNAFLNVYDKKIVVKDAGRRLGDVVGAYTNNDKAKKLLGWTLDYSIEDGIRDMLLWTEKERFKVLGF